MVVGDARVDDRDRDVGAAGRRVPRLRRVDVRVGGARERRAGVHRLARVVQAPLLPEDVVVRDRERRARARSARRRGRPRSRSSARDSPQAPRRPSGSRTSCRPGQRQRLRPRARRARAAAPPARARRRRARSGRSPRRARTTRRAPRRAAQTTSTTAASRARRIGPSISARASRVQRAYPSAYGDRRVHRPLRHARGDEPGPAPRRRGPVHDEHPAGRGARARGRRLGPRPRRGGRPDVGRARSLDTWGRQANENPPKLLTHDRYGNRIDEVEFHPAYHELMALASAARAARAAVDEPRRERARRARRDVHVQRPGRRRARLPDHDDLRGGARAAHDARARRRVDPEAHRGGLRARAAAPTSASAKCGMAMTEKQGGSDVRANTTTAPRRRRRRVPADRPQVVLQRADVRRLPRPREDRRGRLLLPRPAHPARRLAQHLPPAAPQGQARQPLQRLERGRVRPDVGPARRRGRPRRADDHRDGRPHAAGLRDRQRDRHARRRRRRDLAHRAPQRVREGARSTSR